MLDDEKTRIRPLHPDPIPARTDPDSKKVQSLFAALARRAGVIRTARTP
jgi:hypothetical protein